MLPEMKHVLRNRWLVFLCGAGLLAPPARAGSSCCTASAPPPVSPLPASESLGWPHAFRLQNDQAEAVIVPAVGRLVHFAPLGDESLFRLDPALQGRTPAEGDAFFNVGGDWMWPVAQARWGQLSGDGKDWPPPAPIADGAWTGSAWTDADGAQCVLMTREYGAPLHLLASRLFRLAPGSGTLVVQQRLERTAESDVPVVLWNVSQIARAERIALPIEKNSRFRTGLIALMGRRPPREQMVSCTDSSVYLVRPGAETKLGSDSLRGWIAASRGTNAVFESVANSVTGEYPDGGCVVEVYSNEGLGYSEIETLSPETALAPGAVLENVLRIELGATESAAEDCAVADLARKLAGEE